MPVKGTIEQRWVIQHDAITGERLGELLALVPQRAKSAFSAGFFMASLNIGALGKQIKSAQELRVFLHLLGRLEYNRNNLINVAQDEIAEELGVRQPNVALALKRLEERGIVAPRGRGAYQLNPELVWRGAPGEHRDAIEDYRSLREWRAEGIADRDRVIIWEQWQTTLPAPQAQ